MQIRPSCSDSTGQYRSETGQELRAEMRLAAVLFVLSFVLASASRCYSADIVFVRASEGSSAAQEQLELAARFYGVNLQVIVASPSSQGSLLSVAGRGETLGVVIAANTLADIDRDTLLKTLHRKRGDSVPILVLGTTADVDPMLLKTWSGGTDLHCRRIEDLTHAQYVFGKVEGLTWQLATLEVPLLGKSVFYFDLGQNSAVQQVMMVRQGQEVLPVFIETAVGGSKLFIASALSPNESKADGQEVVSAFLSVAPAMMFIRYCAGERAWHAPGHFANLTIDDPWLREPYGFVDYKGLLEEMEKHNFHTTIAFIPWNYDRSQAEVVSLFRDHPERLSISIHGDNHDHKEFTDYRSKPLAVQIMALKQSLARMERFRAATGIPYDRVMVFPHSVAPEKTFDALKTYNYWATVNSTNVPQGGDKPSDPAFDLRPVTLLFAGFPSISRYSVAAPISKSLIGINQFLGNPLLFYGHSDFFDKGAGAFDTIADEVNELAPDTEWRGLGDVVKHLYLVKRRDDSSFDVLSFSNNVCLENTSGRDSMFYVRKPESGPQAISSLTVDGQSQEYKVEAGYLGFGIHVAAKNVRCVAIEYRNDLNLAEIDASRASAVVYLLRKASDFRDIYLAKSASGRAVTTLYYRYKGRAGLPVLCLVAVIVVGLYLGYRVFAWKSAHAHDAKGHSRPGNRRDREQQLQDRRASSDA